MKARRRGKPIEWTEEILTLLGKVRDRELSERFGISESAIRKKRERQGIPPAKYEAVPRTEQLVEALGLPLREAVRRSGLKPSTIDQLRRKWGIRPLRGSDWRWTPEILARLGREADTRIARETGFGFRKIRAKRQALGIAPFCRWRPWQPEEDALLGTAPDKEVAERIGRSPLAVQVRRLRLRIAAWRPAGRKAP